ncbi:hypothetical protein [Roseicella aerolata]|uniref:Uncharacterized protein n=1 Tax=Roseicella aerolata TaxID=2883479 RepID=A0A9X1IKY1_9PROT|nr:hypothetical protein [Roseicella aerolata]MCB4825528.1 hypothetical protein [Roseicella aerolata]
MLDYDRKWADYARWTPPLQPPQIDFPFAPPGRYQLPSGLTSNEVNPLSRNGKVGFHSHALLSAGVIAQGQMHRLSQPMRNAVSERDRARTRIMGDSGGFQVLTMNLAINDIARDHQLRWSERYCDGALPLEVPSAAAHTPGNRYFGNFDLALHDSEESHQFFEDHYKGDTGMMRLAVMQGHTRQEVQRWYGVMKRFHWGNVARGGAMRFSFTHEVRFFRQMYSDGYLENVQWVHYLGTGDPGVGLLLTALRRALSRKLGRNVLVTYDAVTPHLYAYADQKAIVGVNWSGRGPTLLGVPLGKVGRPTDAEARAPLPGSAVGCLDLTLADLRPRPQPNANGWDEPGRILLSSHNLDAMANAIILCNQLADLNSGLSSPIPHAILQARQVIESMFDDPNIERELRHKSRQLNLFAKLRPEQGELL